MAREYKNMIENFKNSEDVAEKALGNYLSQCSYTLDGYTRTENCMTNDNSARTFEIIKAYERVDGGFYYDWLGIDEDASLPEITAAVRKAEHEGWVQVFPGEYGNPDSKSIIAFFYDGV